MERKQRVAFMALDRMCLVLDSIESKEEEREREQYEIKVEGEEQGRLSRIPDSIQRLYDSGDALGDEEKGLRPVLRGR